MDKVTILDGKEFKCQQCGACCKHLNKIHMLSSYDRGDGICKFLRNDNKCSIYNNRPLVCRGEYIYHKYYEGMDVIAYYDMLYDLCNKIRRMTSDERLQKNI